MNNATLIDPCQRSRRCGRKKSRSDLMNTYHKNVRGLRDDSEVRLCILREIYNINRNVKNYLVVVQNHQDKWIQNNRTNDEIE